MALVFGFPCSSEPYQVRFKRTVVLYSLSAPLTSASVFAPSMARPLPLIHTLPGVYRGMWSTTLPSSSNTCLVLSLKLIALTEIKALISSFEKVAPLVSLRPVIAIDEPLIEAKSLVASVESRTIKPPVLAPPLLTVCKIILLTSLPIAELAEPLMVSSSPAVNRITAGASIAVTGADRETFLDIKLHTEPPPWVGIFHHPW